jgi:hypothetical protein
MLKVEVAEDNGVQFGKRLDFECIYNLKTLWEINGPA